MRRRPLTRPLTLLLSLGLPLALTAGAACTAFNDIILPTDAGADDALDAPPLDAAPDVTSAGASYLTPAQAGRFCGLMLDCPLTVPASALLSFQVPFFGGDLIRSYFSLCMHWMTEVVHEGHVGFARQRAIFQALAQVPDCTAAILSLPIEIADASPCTSAFSACSADNAKLVYCSDGGPLVVEPCAPPFFPSGGTCGTVLGRPECLLDGCAQPGCANSVAQSCVGGGAKSVAFDCAVIHRECVATSPARCIAPACATPGTSCDGTNVSVCWDLGSGLESVAFACPPGTQCTQAGTKTFFCGRSPPACAPGTFVDQCAGSQIVYCADGATSRFDCASAQSGWTCKSTPVPHCGP